MKDYTIFFQMQVHTSRLFYRRLKNKDYFQTKFPLLRKIMDAQLCSLYFCGFNTKSILRYTPSIIFFKKLFDMWEYAEMKIHRVPNEDKKLHKMIIKLIQTNKRIFKRWNLLLENYFILILNSPYTTVCKLKDTHLKNGYYAVCYTPPFFWPF